MSNMKILCKQKKGIFFFTAMIILAACMFVPQVQNVAISFVESAIGRELRDHAKCKNLFTQFGCIAIFIEMFIALIHFNPKNLFTEIIPKNKERLLVLFCIVSPIAVLLYIILPYFIFGENSVITIWDLLDSYTGWNRFIRDGHYLFKLNTPTNQFGGISSVYFANGCANANFTLLTLIHYIFSEVIAHGLCLTIVMVIGFLSTYYLLKTIFGITYRPLYIFVALIYAILPVLPYYSFSASTLPAVILLFYHIATKQILSKKYFLFAFLYPVICEFSATGIFICGFWFISFIILSIRRKKIQWNLLTSLIVMSAGFVLVNFRLFYMRLIENEPLNRDFFTTVTNPIDSFKMYFLHGQAHASSLHNKYILPITSCVFLFVLWSIFCKHRNKNFSIVSTDAFKNSSIIIIIKTLAISFACIFIFSIIAAIDGTGILRKLFSVICPPLNGFSFARMYFFNRLLWYIAFCASLVFLWENSNFTKFVSVILVILQIHIVLTATVPFADSYASWKRNLEHGGKEKYITFKEFFSESQFDEIKKYINYDGENVAAYGYHPSVLMYNGFNCIDGYVSTYPYKDMLKFRTLIAPALEVDEETKTYYDSWGGRRYLYPSPRGLAAPTREKHTEPIPLYINPEVFRNGYNGKYILSSYPISNANELGFELVKSFDSDDSIYIIYVYACR